MKDNLKLLFKLATTLQNTINNASKEDYMGCRSYIRKYNDLFKKISEIDSHVKDNCNSIENPEEDVYGDPIGAINAMNSVKVELNTLITCLEQYMDKTEDVINRLINLLKAKLRVTFKEKPNKEKEVQDNVDIILNVGNYKYSREKVTIPYSSKSFIPDFTFNNLNIALEIKLCNRDGKEKEIIDEINADIQAYKTKYKNQIFLVYDNGYIRDVQRFRQDISNDLDIYVDVIKH